MLTVSRPNEYRTLNSEPKHDIMPGTLQLFEVNSRSGLDMKTQACRRSYLKACTRTLIGCYVLAV